MAAGIGAAIAEFLLEKSHNVILIARTEQPLDELRKRYPDQVLVLAGDLADSSLAQKAVDSALEVFGELNGLIVNHGMMDPVTKIETSSIEDWKKLFDVNFFSAVAFVSIDNLETVLCLTETGQSSCSVIAQDLRLRPLHFFGRFNWSILNMGRMYVFSEPTFHILNHLWSLETCLGNFQSLEVFQGSPYPLEQARLTAKS